MQGTHNINHDRAIHRAISIAGQEPDPVNLRTGKSQAFEVEQKPPQKVLLSDVHRWLHFFRQKKVTVIPVEFRSIYGCNTAYSRLCDPLTRSLSRCRIQR